VHNYPSSSRVTGVCDCCKLLNDLVFRSAPEVAICRGCQRHIGDSADACQLRDSDHAALYLSEIQLLQKQLTNERTMQRGDYERELASLQSQLGSRVEELAYNAQIISGLREALRDGELRGGGLAEWLADEELADAQAERDSARRATGLVLEALSRLTAIHGTHSTRPHYCICGDHVDQCLAYRAIESELKVVAKWEREQFARYRDGLDHRLSPHKIQSMTASTALRRNA